MKREPRENKVWYLKSNRLFEDSADDSVRRWEHIFTMREYPKHAAIFAAGDEPRSVYLVKRGHVRIGRLTADGKEITVAMLGPGDLFGEEALFGSRERSTVATAMDDTLVCVSSADDLFTVLSESPSIALNVAKMLNDRLVDMSAQVEDVAYAKVADRLVNLFERLVPEHGVDVEDGVKLDVALTHADLAALIGSTRETVTTELSALVRAGRIRVEGRTITLLRAPAGGP
ncbi:MAG TPA: Crp/Fnr family transcriptional regulator [Candidatus Baltobacteraceae bacterium]|nr:Crp/Fnr family transcriptional regulator [Candidatus Baltobacteraceae bacterium]